MFKTHKEARETVREFCEKARGGEKPNVDPEQIRLAFFHIYYCWRKTCADYWSELREKETSPVIEEWLQKWADKPLGTLNLWFGHEPDPDPTQN